MVTMDQIRNATNKALAGSKKVRITFGPRNMDDTCYLLALERQGVVQLNLMDQAVMMAVCQSRSWDHDSNRTLTITIGQNFDTQLFADRMMRALDRIAAVE